MPHSNSLLATGFESAGDYLNVIRADIVALNVNLRELPHKQPYRFTGEAMARFPTYRLLKHRAVGGSAVTLV